MNKDKVLIQVSDNKKINGCSSYNHENGNCKDTNKPCNMCFTQENFKL